MSWHFDRHERQWTIPLSITLPLILALVALAFWSEVEKKVSAGSQQCLSSADSEAHQCLVRDPIWIGQKWKIRERTVEVGEAWWSRDFRYVRSGLFSTREVVDPKAYLQIAFLGTDFAQEHIWRPLDVRIDGQPAKLYLAEAGSVIRVAPTESRSDHLLEVRDAGTVIASYRLEGKQKTAQPGATDNPDDAQRLREDH